MSCNECWKLCNVSTNIAVAILRRPLSDWRWPPPISSVKCNSPPVVRSTYFFFKKMPSHQIFTLRMATAMFTKMAENFQHSVWLIWHVSSSKLLWKLVLKHRLVILISISIHTRLIQTPSLHETQNVITVSWKMCTRHRTWVLKIYNFNFINFLYVSAPWLDSVANRNLRLHTRKV